MSETKQEIPLWYIVRVVKKYFGVYPKSYNTSISEIIDYAIKQYGIEKVKFEIAPAVPEIIKRTFENSKHLEKEDDRPIFESFCENYDKGATVYLGSLPVIKK